MSQSVQFSKIQYGPEASAYGTEAVSYTELARVQSIDLDPGDNSFIYDRGLGEGLNISNTYYGPFKSNNNSITFDVVDFDFLKHWIGNLTGAGTAISPYTLTEATSISTTAGIGILQPFSIEELNDNESTDSVNTALGCVGTTFSLEGSIGSKLTCKANFTAQKTLFRTSGETYTAVTDPAFIMLNGTFKWGATPTAISGVQEFTLNYDNGLIFDDETRDAVSRFQAIPNLGKGRKYTGRIGIKMATALATTIINDFYGYSSGGVYSPNTGSTSISPTADLEFKIELVNGSKYATIWVDQCSIDRLSKPVSLGGGLVILFFEFTAKYGKDNAPIKWWSV
jgi:hypothetical protein